MTDNRFSVVLIDDVDDLRRLVAIALEKSGRFRVVGEAGNGLEGIERVNDLKPDLVLLDLSMPVMDGLEALPRIRTASPASKVVVHSGFKEEAMGERVRADGALAYLEKGLTPKELVDELLAVAGVLETVESALVQARHRLAGERTSPGAARRFINETLDRWDCGSELDTVNLLVSELVTNAVVHAQSPVEVLVRLTADGLRVDVVDQSPELPKMRVASDEDTSGRGLALVQQFARAWGVDQLDKGKSVWFEMPRFDSDVA